MTIIGFGLGGMIVGMFFGFIYAVIYLLTGGMPTPDGSTISPISAFAMYMSMCGIGGLLVGALRTWLRSVIGSAILGTIGAVPLMLGSFVLVQGSFSVVDWWGVLITSVLIGVPFGIWIRKEFGVPLDRSN